MTDTPDAFRQALDAFGGAYAKWQQTGDGAEALEAAQATVERLYRERPQPRCPCGKLATCIGAYEGKPEHPACDDCCGHGNEDGHCKPIDRERPRREPSREVIEALRWLVHLCHDVGKGGGKPEVGEWEAACHAGQSALEQDAIDGQRAALTEEERKLKCAGGCEGFARNGSNYCQACWDRLTGSGT